MTLLAYVSSCDVFLSSDIHTIIMSIEVLKHTPNLQAMPLAAPPAGVIPNYDPQYSRAYEVFATAGVCLPIAFMFAAARLYVKTAVIRKVSRDDYVFMLALASGIVYISLVIALGANNGYGQHEWVSFLS